MDLVSSISACSSADPSSSSWLFFFPRVALCVRFPDVREEVGDFEWLGFGRLDEEDSERGATFLSWGGVAFASCTTCGACAAAAGLKKFKRVDCAFAGALLSAAM